MKLAVHYKFCSWVISVQSTAEEFIDFVKLAYGKDVNISPRTNGVVVPLENESRSSFVVLLWCRDFTPSVVAHEALHVIESLYEEMGQICTFDETTCYLLSELVDNFYDLKNAKNLTAKTALQELNKYARKQKRK